MTVVQITIVPKLYYSVRKAGQVIQGKKHAVHLVLGVRHISVMPSRHSYTLTLSQGTALEDGIPRCSLT